MMGLSAYEDERQYYEQRLMLQAREGGWRSRQGIYPSIGEVFSTSIPRLIKEDNSKELLLLL